MPRDLKNIRHFVVFLFLLSSLLLRIQATASFIMPLLGGLINYFNQCVYALLVSTPRAHVCTFQWSFYLCNYSSNYQKKICHAHIHALLSGLFYATCAHLRHYVVLTLLGGAEHTRVNWDLASVTCLGIFACSS